MLLVLQLQSTGNLAPGGLGKMLGGRGMKRGDDMSSGGRLSRRNADPIAEAERKAQQEKLYSLDLERVLAGAHLLASGLSFCVKRAVRSEQLCPWCILCGCSFVIIACTLGMRTRVLVLHPGT